MGWLSDLLKEYPALSVARERLALIEDRLKAADEENKKLRTEVAELQSECAVLKKQAVSHENAKQFIEFKGVLWKQFDESVDPLPYCPECKLAMSAFPPESDEMLICSKCNFTAPFPPSQIEAMAQKLETALLLV